MTTAPDVVAVILAHDSLGVLGRLVHAVQGQTWRPAETIVVDNGSRDGTGDLCRRLPDITPLALRENVGIGAGHNVGWAAALSRPSCQFVWALEHDCVPSPDCLETLLRAHRALGRDGRVGVVSPQQVFDAGPRGPRYVLVGFRLRALGVVDRTGEPRLGGGLTFNGCLLPRQTLERVGFLDEALFIGHEDLDYRDRLAAAGYAIVKVPRAHVAHDAYRHHRHVRLLGRTLLLPGADVARTYYFNRNMLYRRTRGAGSVRAGLTWGFRLAAAVVYTLLFRGEKRRRLAALAAATRDGFRGRLGPARYRFLATTQQ